MIKYCTLVYGKELCELYSSKLNEFANAAVGFENFTKILNNKV